MRTTPRSATDYIQTAILPLLLYCAPVSAETLRFEYNKLKYITVQRLMNIQIVKAFRTASSEALYFSWNNPDHY